jgi:hypothetical protein
MIRHFRTYHDPGCTCPDCRIGYSAAGYQVTRCTPPDPQPGAQAWKTGRYVTCLRELAAEGQPFTVRDFTARYGASMRSAHLYSTLAALVHDGLLTRTVDAHKVSVFQGVQR